MHLKRTDRRAKLFLWMSICCVALLLTEMGLAQSQLPNVKGDNTAHSDRQKAAQSGALTDILRQLNTSFQALVAKASPAVVEVLVTGFGRVEETNEGKTALVGRQSKLGSGVIVDPDGYIVTNAHVVSGAQSIQVVVATLSKDIEGRAMGKTTYVAHLVGVHKRYGPCSAQD